MRITGFLCVTCFVISTKTLPGQEATADPEAGPQETSELDIKSPTEPIEEVKANFDEDTAGPSRIVANEAIVSLLNSGAKGHQLLKGLDIEFKVLQGGDETSLGFGYQYKKSLDIDEWYDGSTSRGLQLSFEAKGNVAVEDGVNPEDFLTTKGLFRFYQNSGGVAPRVFADGTAKSPEDFWKHTYAEWNEALDARAFAETDDQIRAANAKLDSLNSQLSTQYYFDLSANGGLEANQRFTSRNYTLGARGVFVLNSWRNDSLWTWANILEHPFAAVRYLVGMDEDYRPRGSSWPTVVGNFDWVQTDGNDPRAMVGDASDYPRLSIEAAFKTPVFRAGETVYFFNASYRYFYEIDASSAVKAAGLDGFDYLSLALTTQQGLFFTYRTGQLPFDVDNNDGFELGWKFHF